MEYDDFVKSITDKFERACDACKLVSGRSYYSWVEPDPDSLWNIEYRVSLYRAQDSDGNTYYTFVGSDELSYRRLEYMRARVHKYLVHIEHFHKDFLDILDTCR